MEYGTAQCKIHLNIKKLNCQFNQGHHLKELKLLSTNGKENYLNIRSLVNARSDVLTASDSSIGSSGGTTDVRMSVHSRNNL